MGHRTIKEKIKLIEADYAETVRLLEGLQGDDNLATVAMRIRMCCRNEAMRDVLDLLRNDDGSRMMEVPKHE